MNEEYNDWWLSQFPCSCGHSPDRHILAPIDGVCRACVDCHGEFGAFLKYGSALKDAADADVFSLDQGRKVQ